MLTDDVTCYQLIKFYTYSIMRLPHLWCDGHFSRSLIYQGQLLLRDDDDDDDDDENNNNEEDDDYKCAKVLPRNTDVTLYMILIL